MTTERYFGGRDGRLENLRKTLEWIAKSEPTENELLTWISRNTAANDDETIIKNIRFLEAVDLIEQSAERFSLTNKGSAFERNNTPLVMYEGLEKAVNGFREIARAIAFDHRTLEEIQSVLRENYPDYELPEGVVTKHLDWLRSLQLVTQEDGQFHIPIEDGSFKVGETYNRWFIHDVLKGERYKGISKPSEHPFLLLFTGESGDDYGYEDEFLEDDTFLYTGEGTEDDMVMEDGNRAIRDHKKNGEALHLFESTDLPWIVTYLGEYECVEVRETELEDENGELRDGFRFRLAPVGGTEIEIGGGSPATLSGEELFQKAKQSSPTGNNASSGGSGGGGRSYPRSEFVREFALRMANGVCQGCKEKAPFVDKQGQPFLEVHHLTRQSDGGADDPENVIAICPNCHRRVHQGQDGDEFNRELRNKVEHRNKELPRNG